MQKSFDARLYRWLRRNALLTDDSCHWRFILYAFVWHNINIFSWRSALLFSRCLNEREENSACNEREERSEMRGKSFTWWKIIIITDVVSRERPPYGTVPQTISRKFTMAQRKRCRIAPTLESWAFTTYYVALILVSFILLYILSPLWWTMQACIIKIYVCTDSSRMRLFCYVDVFTEAN